MQYEKLRVGCVHKGYPQIRNITGLPFDNIQSVNVVDIFKIYTHFFYKVFGKNDPISLNLFCDFGVSKVDLLHFFNGISLSNKPWLTTFETTLPRFGSASKFWYTWGIKRLAHDSCKKIMALSNAALEIQKNNLNKNYPQYYQSIIDKTIVLYPPQEMIENHKLPINEDSDIHFAIIGADFFRKGGLEILKVFNRLEQGGVHNWKLNIVSSLQYGDYASKATVNERDEALKLINSNEKIQHYSSLPNDKVIELLQATDVALLPTYADTFGYSVLEAQATGCPVISTDIRALPEINNNQCGWLINVQKDSDGNAVLASKNDRESFSQQIESRLFQILSSEIFSHPQMIREKGQAAVARIKKNHSPLEIAHQLERIYQKAVS